MSLGFLYKYLTGSNNEVQIDKVFWHNSRIYHFIILFITSILLYLNDNESAGITSLIDVIYSNLYRLN